MIALLPQTPVVILAGGLGTRLRPVLADRPKGLAPIGSQSFLEIQISLLRDQGARQFVLCVGHQAAQVRMALGDGRALGVHIDYSEETGRLLGTAGALKQAERFFAPRALVVNGDTFFAIDYERLVHHHVAEQRAAATVATLALAPASDQNRYGSVMLDVSGRFVASFREKEAPSCGAATWVNAGAYMVEQKLFRWVPAGKPCSLENEVFPGLMTAGQKLGAMTAARRFFDIGTPEGLDVFCSYFQELHEGPRPRAQQAIQTV
jgi:NDP-sugar pyrophosphorylase family protein